MADRISPEVADGAPIEGDLIPVIDESSPQNTAGGATYVVAIAAVFDPDRALASLAALFTTDRRRLFHWEREGTIARTRIIEIAAEIGVVATAHYAHVGRRDRSRARQAMLAEMVRDAAAEGVDHLVIEASDAATVAIGSPCCGRSRERAVFHFATTGGRSRSGCCGSPTRSRARSESTSSARTPPGGKCSTASASWRCGRIHECESPGSRPRRPSRILGPALRG